MAAAVLEDRAFVGSIPELYNRYLVPLIFEAYASDLAQRVAAIGPRRVLETAAGTGVLTRALAARIDSQTEILASDLNAPMLDFAKSQMLGNSRVQWRQADALRLPFDSGQFDVVACQFGAMFFPDRVRGYAEARRVLTPGGSLLFSVWDRISENEFADVVTQALGKLFPADPPRFLARTPHGYHDTDRIRRDVAEAGFNHIEIDAVDAVSGAPSPRDPAIAYCHGTPLRGEIEARGESTLEDVSDFATEALAARFGRDHVEGRIRAFVITAQT